MSRMSQGDEPGIITHDEVKIRKRKLRFSFGALCVIWLFPFTAYNGLQNLEAALYQKIGLYTLAALTGGGVISCLLAPTVISYIGSKGALIISWICLCFFVAANFTRQGNIQPYILITAGGIEGFAIGLMWTAQGSYTTAIAMDYHTLVGESLEQSLTNLFGIFCFFFKSTQVWGNLISSIVFQHANQITKHETNHTYCGAEFTPKDGTPSAHGNSTVSPVERELVDMLTGVYLGCVVVGLVLTIIFLKPSKPSMSDTGVTLKSRLLSTIRLLWNNLNMLMLVPFSLYTGMEQVVMYAEFTNSYVTCKLGIKWIGYTMICFGVCATFGSIFVGYIGRYTARPPLYFAATILNLGTLGLMRFWPFSGDVPFYLFFIIPGVWGLADAIWQTQIGALVGTAFSSEKEPAFANLRMFQAFGFTVGYLYNAYLQESIKHYIAAGILLLSMILVTIVEIRIRLKNKVATRLSEKSLLIQKSEVTS